MHTTRLIELGRCPGYTHSTLLVLSGDDLYVQVTTYHLDKMPTSACIIKLKLMTFCAIKVMVHFDGYSKETLVLVRIHNTWATQEISVLIISTSSEVSLVQESLRIKQTPKSIHSSHTICMDVAEGSGQNLALLHG